MPPELEVQNISSVLDKEQRETLEDIVIEMREEVEADLQTKLYETYQVDDKDNPPSELDEKELEIREQLIRAIEREQLDEHAWGEAIERYRRSVGFTNINRFCAFRAMEVRDLIDRPVTRFKEGNRTPASDPIIEEEFETPEDAFFLALHRQGDEIAEEIELLFDRSGPYSWLEPSFSTAKKLCSLMDELADEIWAADDVLGWVYEYYNVPDLGDVRSQAKDADDVIKGNQFYTPHWVVRQLTDNTLGKMFLEYKGELQEAIDYQQEHFDPEGRKYRSIAPEDSSTVKDLCTYLVPTETEGEGPDWEDPSEIKVFDPACGSGHFLLYAFDVLERIWWEMNPEIPKKEIPEKILENNIYGIDLDLRATQLAAFNLWMKAKQRTQEEEGEAFNPDKIQIVCADARLVDTDPVEEVFEKVAEKEEVQRALENLVETFEDVHALGSLLNVKGTMEEVFKKENDKAGWFREESEMSAKSDMADFFDDLHEAIEAQENGESQLYSQDLKSFTRLLKLLSQEYDVSLMNPPYGRGSRMPDNIQDYVDESYQYVSDFYLALFDHWQNLNKNFSYLGMLTPRTFMFKGSMEDVREDIVARRNTFYIDTLSDLGEGVLDNATVATVGTVIKNSRLKKEKASFVRLSDKSTYQKEKTFLKAIDKCRKIDFEKLQRFYSVRLKEFKNITGYPLSYWTPTKVRDLFKGEKILDADIYDSPKDSLGNAKTGLATGNNDRFLKQFWEFSDQSYDETWFPYAKGGKDSWLLFSSSFLVNWEYDGNEIRRAGGTVRNEEYYKHQGLTWVLVKRTGRRFSVMPDDCIFDVEGSSFFVNGESWESLLAIASVLNSKFFHGLMLSITPERHWQVGEVSRLPWPNFSEKIKKTVKDYTKQIHQLRQTQYSYKPTSPVHVKPSLLISEEGYLSNSPITGHPFTKLFNPEKYPEFLPPSSDEKDSLPQRFDSIVNWEESMKNRCEDLADQIDQLIYDELDIDEQTQEAIQQEIYARTIESPEREQKRRESDLDYETEVKRLLQFFAQESLKEDDDGIVLLNLEGEVREPALLNRIKTQFQKHFDDYAQDRMREADEALGSKSSTEEMFPNIRNWLENQLFKFHLSEFENTPIVWKLTSSRLGDLSNVEGFSCLIDYHQLDGQTLDRIRNQYLDDRKAVLAEKRNQARRRADDESLPPEERQKAEEKITEYREAHEQVEALDDKLKELGQVHPRDWTEEDQEFAQKVHQKVERFEGRMKERLDQIDRLVGLAGKEFVKDLYSDTFLSRLEEDTDEWFEDLQDLKEACKAYAKSNEKRVPAHLYDLFDYCRENTIKGTYFNSSGFLFMNFYLKYKENYSRDSRTDVDQEVLKLVEKLSVESTKDVNLGEEIRDDLKELSKRIPSDWKDRAVQEVMNEGYTPIDKHGVAINIEPLADAKVVPEIVEDKVVLS